ncbi:MAG: hypothetical protein H8D23_21620 [Candidatus Brocadiales bacterium]|nr:hypothetical protein [Candidatus Brocadiales bacterium]
MPDITKCTDDSCPMRWKCYRFMVAPSEYRQSYFEKSPRDGSECEYFEGRANKEEE